MYFCTIFLWCNEKSFKQKTSNIVNQKKIKSSWKEYVKCTYFKFWPMLKKGCLFKKLENNCRLLLFFKFIQIQKRYPTCLKDYLKTTCHIKPKIFLWTRLLKSLPLAKYLISVTASLRKPWGKKLYQQRNCSYLSTP